MQFRYVIQKNSPGTLARFGKVKADYQPTDSEFVVDRVKPGWRIDDDGMSVRPPSKAEIATDTAPTIADIKAEASRRILAILPEWKQRNLLAQATELVKIGEANWTIEQAAEWDAGQALWNQVRVIRAASNTLEGMDPIPSDYADDSYWEV